MEDEFANNVVSLYESDKWADILQLDIDHSNEKIHSLLWVWPSRENLLFIKEVVEKYNLKGVTSIGCGSGLFEWLLQKCTDMEVTGIEVDESWWNSKYVKYRFMSLTFIKMPPKENFLPINHALLFCYFNNGPAFKEYIKLYKGFVVFIIGPGPQRGTSTNPEPFAPDFGSTEWDLVVYQEIKNSKDFIAVYHRKSLSGLRHR